MARRRWPGGTGEGHDDDDAARRGEAPTRRATQHRRRGVRRGRGRGWPLRRRPRRRRVSNPRRLRAGFQIRRVFGPDPVRVPGPRPCPHARGRVAGDARRAVVRRRRPRDCRRRVPSSVARRIPVLVRLLARPGIAILERFTPRGAGARRDGGRTREGRDNVRTTVGQQRPEDNVRTTVGQQAGAVGVRRRLGGDCLWVRARRG
mmetsp:Transcript_10085/g.39391  ORF Transcript_10085/g.39391 Transcript_10085/m.39391 type:complete len:204 (+) Transcript_10085:1874-2485(+)